MSEIDRLMRLPPEAEAPLLTREVAEGQMSLAKDPRWTEFARPLSRAVNLDLMHRVAEDAIRSLPQGDTRLDPLLSRELHRALPLDRREAADPGVFRFLAVVARPDLVRHRWSDPWPRSKERFWRPGTRPNSNAFSRWWWLAELTREGSDYSLTDRLFKNGALCTAVSVRIASHSKLFVRAAIDVLVDSDQQGVESAMKRLSAHFATIPLEAFSYEQLLEEIARIRDAGA